MDKQQESGRASARAASALLALASPATRGSVREAVRRLVCCW